MGITPPQSSTALLRPVHPGIHGEAGSQGPSHPSRKSLNCEFSALPSALSLAVALFGGELASSGVHPPHLLLQALASVAGLLCGTVSPEEKRAGGLELLGGAARAAQALVRLGHPCPLNHWSHLNSQLAQPASLLGSLGQIPLL